MSGTEIFICILLGAIIIFLFFIFIRASYAFKGIFGVFPKKATQEMVDLEIKELQKTLVQKEDGLGHFSTEEDRDRAGMAQNSLERAKKLAQKYSFTIPE